MVRAIRAVPGPKIDRSSCLSPDSPLLPAIGHGRVDHPIRNDRGAIDGVTCNDDFAGRKSTRRGRRCGGDFNGLARRSLTVGVCGVDIYAYSERLNKSWIGIEHRKPT